MEEKERYYYKKILRDCVIPEGLFEIKDREGNFYLIIENKKDVDTITNLLNQQDKKLSKLRASYQQVKEENQQLIKALNGDIFINYKVPMENAKLKQQLHDLPKKIVGEVEKNFTEYLPLKYKTGAGFYLRLNTILKKYGGEDE